MLFSVLVMSAAAHAFSLMPSAESSDARWRDFPVRFSINAANSPFSEYELHGILSDAFAFWNAVPTTKMRADLGGATSVDARALISGGTRESAVVFDPHFREDLSISDTTVLAVGTAVSNGDRYTQGFIIVNAGARGVRDPAQLRVILAHEAGHAFGMGHTADEAALMYPYVQRLDRLGDDDANGISYMYPLREGVNGMPFGCGTIAKQRGAPRFPGLLDDVATSKGAHRIWLVWMTAFIFAWAGSKTLMRYFMVRRAERDEIGQIIRSPF